LLETKLSRESSNLINSGLLSYQVTSDDFIAYLDAARLEALPERESAMFSLRYGLSGGKVHLLAEIGNQYGISRERVRQLLQRSHRRIISRAKKQLKTGKTNLPCASLLLYVRNLIKPEKTGSNGRFLKIIEKGIPFLPVSKQLLEFIAKLAYPNSDSALENSRIVHDIILHNRLEDSKRLSEALRLDKTRRLITHAIWPKCVRRLNTEEIGRLKRHRDISLTGDGNAGSFFSHKLNRDVQYESDLERRFLQQVELDDSIVVYQEQPLGLSYTLEGRRLTYYPDILLIFKDNRGLIVEIKPLLYMALRQNLAKWKALRRFCENNGLGLLITDGKYSMWQIQKHKGNNEYVDDILSCLCEGPILWPRYKQIRARYNPSRTDFVAMVLENELCWELGPFRLSQNESNEYLGNIAHKSSNDCICPCSYSK